MSMDQISEEKRQFGAFCCVFARKRCANHFSVWTNHEQTKEAKVETVIWHFICIVDMFMLIFSNLCPSQDHPVAPISLFHHRSAIIDLLITASRCLDNLQTAVAISPPIYVQTFPTGKGLEGSKGSAPGLSDLGAASAQKYKHHKRGGWKW